jgi:hypothetical protein
MYIFVSGHLGGSDFEGIESWETEFHGGVSGPEDRVFAAHGACARGRAVLAGFARSRYWSRLRRESF